MCERENKRERNIYVYIKCGGEIRGRKERERAGENKGREGKEERVGGCVCVCERERAHRVFLKGESEGH